MVTETEFKKRLLEKQLEETNVGLKRIKNSGGIWGVVGVSAVFLLGSFLIGIFGVILCVGYLIFGVVTISSLYEKKRKIEMELSVYRELETKKKKR